MGSEGPSIVKFHVTGFKKFHGVAENPTETIVSNLKAYMQKKGIPEGVVLGSCNVLETAGYGALAPLYQTLESAIAGKDSESSNSEKIIWVSFSLFFTFTLTISLPYLNPFEECDYLKVKKSTYLHIHLPI